MLTATGADFSLRAELILPTLLRSRAGETPDAVFAREIGGPSRTYAEMHDGALAHGAYFQQLGIAREEVVATFLPASIRALEIWLGLSWAGAIEAALNTGYRHQLLADVLNDTRATVVVTTSDFVPRLVEVAGLLEHVDRLVLIDVDERDIPSSPVDGWAMLPGADAGATAFEVSSFKEPRLEDTSCVLYTSGTTGPSKGVVIPWAQMLESGRTIIPVEHMDADDVFYCPYAPCHITGKAYFYSMLLVGGGYVVKQQFRTSDFWPEVVEYGCTTTLLQGAMAHFLLNQAPSPLEQNNPLDKVIVAPVIAEVQELERRFGVRVGTVYNMTELSCPLVSDGWVNDGIGSCGTVREGVTVRLVDDLDREVPVGEIGELVVRHDDPWTMSTGYLRRPEATVQANRNNWFHTGDTFYRDEHDRYFFVDRKKDAIRRRGENISSAEVEREVRPFPGVKEVAAVAAESEFGEDEVRLIIVEEPGISVEPAELHEFLKTRMAAYMLPRYIDIVDSIPKTETQKIQKNLLRKLPISDTTWEAPQRRASK
ncbi:AMP-binding protein [Ruicaihuangia caeni]|uniref:AMP-binding protein n=1 Tax=Ruicaihuangia caeni TaxID=3042517 RepID=A0AAW6T8C0_9MICO|nr:AMP-binding protein [Klugiella sp. YN-L-19]MDI2099474.1 AMP-binding protein [Klugiella sp. YN-L-19]